MHRSPKYFSLDPKKRLLLMLPALLFFLINVQTITAQKDSVTGKSTLHAGMTALPVFDVLNLFPANVIKGFAVMGNVGFFVTRHLSFGFQPFYGEVSNTYTGFNQDPFGERQNLRIAGSNTTLRYSFLARKPWLVYILASAGFGVMEETITAVKTSQVIPGSRKSNAIATCLAGVGANYFFTRNIAAELNVPYGMMYNFNAPAEYKYFLTAAPMLGLQVYWK
jgi:hypothetical protein